MSMRDAGRNPFLEGVVTAAVLKEVQGKSHLENLNPSSNPIYIHYKVFIAFIILSISEILRYVEYIPANEESSKSSKES